MGTRGKRSASELMITGGPHAVAMQRPDAPYDLDDEEADEWRAIVAAMPADYFARSHYPTLTQYCRHIVTARHIAQLITAESRKKNIDGEKYARLLMMQGRETSSMVRLARSMRLNHLSIWVPQSKGARPIKGATNTIEAPWNRNSNPEVEDGEDSEGGEE